MSHLREIAAPFVAATPTGASTTGRLRVTPGEAAMLAEMGGFLGGLFGTDFAQRAAEGRLDSEGRAVSRRDRKRALTGVSSSRWAGAITRASEDQYNMGVRALHDHRRSLRQAAAAIESRLAVGPGQVTVTSRGRRVRGYKTKAEWFAKTRRLNGLRHRLAQAEARAVLAQQNTLAVDVNDQFLAAWVIDAAGNPVAAHHTISVITGNLPASTRDGHLRHAVTQLIRLAQAHGCGSVTIENLNLDAARATGRETMGRGAQGKRFRKTVAGIPTGQFRARLVGMAAEARLSVIGRRGKHQPARRRPVPGLRMRQRTHTDPPATRSTAHDPADASPVEPAPPPPDPTDTIQPGQAEKSTRMREPNTVRGTTEQDSLLLGSTVLGRGSR